MKLKGKGFVLRSWKKGDEASLAKHANNPRVSRNLMDGFPYPYTMKDARAWIRGCQSPVKQKTNLAIVIGDGAVGGMGLELKEDNFKGIASFGYWLGEQYWGRGIMTKAVKLFTQYAFRQFHLRRMEAGVYAWNPASARVLEKAGYMFEGKLRKRVIKRGRVVDELMYAKVR